VRRLAVLALVVATATLAPPALAASRPALTRLWHAYPLGHTRLQTTPPPASTAATGPATGSPRSHRIRPRRPATEDSPRVTAVLASAAAAVTVLVMVAVGRHFGWILRGAGREPVRPRRRILPGDPAQVAFFAAAAVIGIVVGILIPLIA
jgi:hypothetical protein